MKEVASDYVLNQIRDRWAGRDMLRRVKVCTFPKEKTCQCGRTMARWSTGRADEARMRTQFKSDNISPSLFSPFSSHFFFLFQESNPSNFAKAQLEYEGTKQLRNFTSD